MHPAFRSVDACRVLWQLEGYTLKPSKHKTEAGYAGVAPVGKRWKAQIWSAEQRKAVNLGTYDRPEEAALALAKHRSQLAGQSMEEEDSEGGVEEEEDSSQDEDEAEAEESAHRPTEVRLLSQSVPYSPKLLADLRVVP